MRIDNLSTVAGDIGLLPSASFLDGSVPTFVRARNTSGQSIANGTPSPIITNWTNIETQNAAEWNAATGVFTATKAGTYFVSVNLWFNSTTAPLNTQFSCSCRKNGALVSAAYYYSESGTVGYPRNVGFATAIISLVVGETMDFRAFQNSGVSISLVSTGQAWVNTMNICELPGRITRL
jgi:hypothetical protein